MDLIVIILFSTFGILLGQAKTSSFTLSKSLPFVQTKTRNRLFVANHHRHTIFTKVISLSMTTSSTDSRNFKRKKDDSNDENSSNTAILSNSSKLIATHSGTFQADEALAVWILRQTSAYQNSPLIRTRDVKEYSKADIVVDVGGVYSHQDKKYDHHQRDYDERFTPKEVEGGLKEKRCTKLSASGLVYRHYGREIILNKYPDLSEQDLEFVYTKMYDNFMEAVDAIDTGVEQVAGGDGKLLYKDKTGLSIRVSRLNPRWNEIDDGGNVPDVTKRFECASALCGEDFLSALVPLVESQLPARAIVEKAICERNELDSSGEIIKLPTGGLPWRQYLYEIEECEDIDPLIKFVLYTDQAGMWRVQAVTVKGKAFENRLSLPEEWRGIRDEDLSIIAGIEGCTFCHAAGFIGGNETFEGALKMARSAIAKK